jgi:hypothetical protein
MLDEDWSKAQAWRITGWREKLCLGKAGSNRDGVIQGQFGKKTIPSQEDSCLRKNNLGKKKTLHIYGSLCISWWKFKNGCRLTGWYDKGSSTKQQKVGSTNMTYAVSPFRFSLVFRKRAENRVRKWNMEGTASWQGLIWELVMYWLILKAKIYE